MVEHQPRTGVDLQLALDFVHAAAQHASLAHRFEDAGVIYEQGALGTRPPAGTPGKFWRVVGDIDRIYYDDGQTWITLGNVSYPADGPQNVACLRTLGPGNLQGAPGDHSHNNGDIPGIETEITKLWAAIEDLKIMLIMGAYR